MKIIDGIYAGEVINGKKICSYCKRLLFVKFFKKNVMVKCGYHSWCKSCILWDSRLENRILKMEMIIAYGGKCVCCGEKGIEFLTLDHVNDDGRIHRAIIGGLGIKVWLDLKRKNWPKDGYAILCWNCNCAKKYGKFCMHNNDRYFLYNKKLESYLRYSKKRKYYILKKELESM